MKKHFWATIIMGVGYNYFWHLIRLSMPKALAYMYSFCFILVYEACLNVHFLLNIFLFVIELEGGVCIAIHGLFNGFIHATFRIICHFGNTFFKFKFIFTFFEMQIEGIFNKGKFILQMGCTNWFNLFWNFVYFLAFCKFFTFLVYKFYVQFLKILQVVNYLFHIFCWNTKIESILNRTIFIFKNGEIWASFIFKQV